MFKKIKKLIERDFDCSVLYQQKQKNKVFVNIIVSGNFDMFAMRKSIVTNLDIAGYKAQFVSRNSWLLEVSK